ncbi:MAG TPA: peptidoglycan-binding domain-containing protein [Burkholderiales bacterium]|nr:peptidoglycan-binding domain-containing protein [Burkholderiales bacterium]
MKSFQLSIAVLACAGLAACAGNGIFGDRSSSGQTGESRQASGQRAEPVAASASLVRQVQQALDARGIDGGPVDGVWGEQTEQGVRQFQQAQGLEVTGNLDARTLGALGIGGESAATGGSGPSGNAEQKSEK